MTIFTIGHSTRSFEDFLGLLRAHAVAQVADVRTVPRSRRHPHFSREQLAPLLTKRGANYAHFPALGGLRRPRRDSPNTAWRNDSFRGYADHMQTSAFATAVEELIAFAAAGATAIMCAEAVWWRCHRHLLADALTVRGVTVRHILDAAPPAPHQLGEFARTDGTLITYPEDNSVLRRGRGNRSLR